MTPLQLPAQLYTPQGKVATSILIDDRDESVSIFNPIHNEVLAAGENCQFTFVKRGWFFTEFVCSDPQKLFRFKILVYNKDGDTIRRYLQSWGK